MQPRSSGPLISSRQDVDASHCFVLDLMNEPSKNSPRSCRFRASNSHDGRERIRLCEIHQMNYFDDDVCLLRILVVGTALLRSISEAAYLLSGSTED